MLLSSLLPGEVFRRVRPGASAGIVATVLIAEVAVGYGLRVRQDARPWDQAASLQRDSVNHVTQALESADGRTLGRGYSVFVFGEPSFTAPGVPVFNETDDLDAAVKARLGARGQHIYPVDRGAFLYCEKHDFWMDTKQVALDDNYGDVDAPQFGAIMFVDATTGRETTVKDKKTCDRSLATFLPGPLLPAA